MCPFVKQNVILVLLKINPWDITVPAVEETPINHVHTQSLFKQAIIME